MWMNSEKSTTQWPPLTHSPGSHALCRQGPSTLAVCLACVLLWPLEHEKAWCKQFYKHLYTGACSYGMLLGSLSLLESGPANLLQLLHGHSQPTDVPAETLDVNEEAIFNAPTITLVKKKQNPIHIAELWAILNYCFMPLTFCIVVLQH